MCEENLFLTSLIITEMKKRHPDLKIWIWSGYTYEQILNQSFNHKIRFILENINGIVTGPYIESLRDITLPMRGSKNQEIIKLKD